MKTILLAAALFVPVAVSGNAQNWPHGIPNNGDALIAFLKEIEPTSESLVPADLRQHLLGFAIHSDTIHIHRVRVPDPPDKYKFWNPESARFLYGDPELLHKPTGDFWMVSITEIGGSNFNCRLNFETFRIEAVFVYPEG